MNAGNAAKVRTRRRHLPGGTVVETRERPTNTAPVADDRPYASTTVWEFNNGKFEAVRR